MINQKALDAQHNAAAKWFAKTAGAASRNAVIEEVVQSLYERSKQHYIAADYKMQDECIRIVDCIRGLKDDLQRSFSIGVSVIDSGATVVVLSHCGDQTTVVANGQVDKWADKVIKVPL